MYSIVKWIFVSQLGINNECKVNDCQFAFKNAFSYQMFDVTDCSTVSSFYFCLFVLDHLIPIGYEINDIFSLANAFSAYIQDTFSFISLLSMVFDFMTVCFQRIALALYLLWCEWLLAFFLFRYTLRVISGISFPSTFNALRVYGIGCVRAAVWSIQPIFSIVFFTEFHFPNRFHLH